MGLGIDEQTIIAEAREVLLLLDGGHNVEAVARIIEFDADLGGWAALRFSGDVVALWEQVGIAANNMLNRRYFEDVKDELNRVTYTYSKRHRA